MEEIEGKILEKCNELYDLIKELDPKHNKKFKVTAFENQMVVTWKKKGWKR